jgi:hypothetical protein
MSAQRKGLCTTQRSHYMPVTNPAAARSRSCRSTSRLHRHIEVCAPIWARSLQPACSASGKERPKLPTELAKPNPDRTHRPLKGDRQERRMLQRDIFCPNLFQPSKEMIMNSSLITTIMRIAHEKWIKMDANDTDQRTVLAWHS